MPTWDRVKQYVAVWGWALFGGAGLVLAGIGLGIVIYAPEHWDNPAARQCFAFSQAILAAGMVAGVLRATQSIGFFKDELRQVVYADDLEGSLIDAKVAWRNLTLGLFRQRFKTLDKDRLSGFDIGGLIGSAEYFYESHQREIVIKWADPDRRTQILVTETVEAKLRTAEIGRPVPFANRYSPDAEGSERSVLEYRFSDGFDLVLTEADLVTRHDGLQEYRTELPHSTLMKLKRVTRKRQQFDLDPFLNFRSNCLWSRPEVTVRCEEADLRFYFRSMGTALPFTAIGVGDIDGLHRYLHAKCDALCLPTQGYMIVVVKIA